VQTIGLISDTHGLLRPQAIRALQRCNHILHAGDIGDAQLLALLRQLAPVSAVRGNNDTGAWAQALPEVLTLQFEQVRVQLLHDLKAWRPAEGGDAQVLVCGHSHRPVIEQRGGVLLVNPGSAGPRRFSLPVSLALLMIDGAHAQAELVTLEVAPPRGGRPNR